MGNIYATLIHDYVVYGKESKYHTIEDVPAKYQTATRVAYEKKYGVPVPEAKVA